MFTFFNFIHFFLNVNHVHYNTDNTQLNRKYKGRLASLLINIYLCFNFGLIAVSGELPDTSNIIDFSSATLFNPAGGRFSVSVEMINKRLLADQFPIIAEFICFSIYGICSGYHTSIFKIVPVITGFNPSGMCTSI